MVGLPLSSDLILSLLARKHDMVQIRIDAPRFDHVRRHAIVVVEEDHISPRLGHDGLLPQRPDRGDPVIAIHEDLGESVRDDELPLQVS